MNLLEAGKLGRTVIVQLTRGDKVIESIDKALREAGIKSAVVVSGIGSLKKLHYHWPIDTATVATDDFLMVEGPIEVGSISGSYIDGVGHYHIVASDLDTYYIGHLENDSEVLYLLEVVLAEFDGCDLERKMTKENVRLVFQKES